MIHLKLSRETAEGLWLLLMEQPNKHIGPATHQRLAEYIAGECGFKSREGGKYSEQVIRKRCWGVEYDRKQTQPYRVKALTEIFELDFNEVAKDLKLTELREKLKKGPAAAVIEEHTGELIICFLKES